MDRKSQTKLDFIRYKHLNISWLPLTIIVIVIFASPSFSQDQRLIDHNTIGWFANTGTFNIKPNVAIHTEYQWRRVNGLENWQQSLFRTGINYSILKDVSVNAGYAFVTTFAYGDYPLEAFPEHRIYEQVVIKNPVGRIDISHRFTLEQRFVGKVWFQNGEKNTDYNYLNRVRYRLRTEIPIINNVADKNKLSIVFMDEIFIGWGKNIGINIFDQNRLMVLVGYKLNQNIKIEAGYLSQILQQGKRINDRVVFQFNNGFILNTHVVLDFIP